MYAKISLIGSSLIFSYLGMMLKMTHLHGNLASEGAGKKETFISHKFWPFYPECKLSISSMKEHLSSSGK